ncbi:glycosyltransferase [Suipraeoptans intestinalis]|uniref:glycosyltransferase n=1 Tax=Suipraeoptans intestinalis TaxID=2606628 RepID=UPI002ED5587D
MLENDIDIFLIPSIWPETFSYTTEEIMQMGMPVMSFDIGAPAERIKKYEKGLIIPEISPQAVLKSVKEEPLIREV